jgi:hypothetical protein
MAKLKKLYYSLTQNTFLEVANLNNTQDIGSIYSSDSLRVIKDSSPVSTLGLLTLVKDLLYNDIQLNLETSQISKILSNGVFKNIGSEFLIEETKPLPNLSKIKVKSGQIKINDAIVFTDDSVDNTLLFGNFIINSNLITGIYSTTFLKVGMSLQSPHFPVSTTIRKITSLTSIEVSENSTTTVSNQPLIIKNDYSYEILNLTIEGDISNGSDIITNLHSVNDLYLGMKINHLNFPPNTIILEKLSSTSIRVSNNSSASLIQISLIFSNKIDFDGFYRRDTIQVNSNNEIVFKLGVENSQIPTDGSQQDRIDSNHYVIYTLLIHRIGLNTFIEDFSKLWKYTGLTSSILPITKGEIDKDYQGFYSIETGDKIHLVNSSGQLLNWESGQSSNVDISSIGAGYTENELSPEFLKFYDRTQLPQSFDSLNDSSLVNIPFKVNNIQNIFGNSSVVPIKKAILAMRNNSADYGNEGIEVQISTANQVFDISESIDGYSQNINISTITMNAFNFISAINGYIVQLNDFILVTDGDGRFQVAKIILINTNTIQVLGLTKPLSISGPFRSKIQIFKNSTISIITDSNTFITNNQLVTQILSGENGKFGLNNEWVKIGLTYSNSPLVVQDKWYFLQVKGYNINPPNWGNLPYITIENPLPQVNDNKTKNAYYQINYSLISGIYPNGDLLIEDELGDLGEEKVERLDEPFFRPSKYNLIANDLSDSSSSEVLQSLMKENDIFVDVKIGRVLFKKGFEPRRVYITYRKINTLNGDSSDNNLRHNILENGYSNNIQNKLIELDLRFKKGTEFKSDIGTNGINSIEDSNFYKGTVDIENNKLQLKDDFDFHNKTSNFDLLKINKSYIDEIISLSKKELFSKRFPINKTIPFNSGVIDLMDKIHRPGLLVNDIQVYHRNKNLKNKETLYKKKFNENIKFLDEINSSVPNQEYSGEFNNLSFQEFKNKNIFKSILRKNNLTIPFSTDEYPIDSVDFKIGNNITYENKSYINSEKYFTKQNTDFDSFELDKMAVVVPFTESSDFSEIEILKNIDSQIIENINPQDFSVDSINNKIVFSYFNLLDNNVIRVYNINKNTTEEKEINSIAQIGIDYVNSNSLQKIKVITKFINENTIVSIWSCLNLGNFELYLSIYNVNKSNVIEVIKENILISDEVYLESFFDFIIQQNNIIITWKQTISKTSFIFYNYRTFQFGSLNVFSNDNVYKDLKLFNFSENIFGILIASFGSLKIRLFNNFEGSVFFNVNSLFYEISASNIATTFDTSILKLNTNNFAVTYSEENISFITTKLCLISDLYFLPDNLKIKTIDLETNLSNRISNINITKVNEDLFCVSYRKNNILTYRLFNNNLEELPYLHKDPNSTPYTSRINSIVKKGLFNSIISVFKESNVSIKLDSFEIKPDFSRISRTQSNSVIDSTLSNIVSVKSIKSENYLVQAYNINNSSIKITIYDVIDKYNPIKINLVPFQVISGTLETNFDIKYIRNESGFEIILVSFTDSGSLKVQPVNILGGTPVLIGVPVLITATIPNNKAQILIYDFNSQFILYTNASNNLIMKEIDSGNISVLNILSPITLIDETTNEFEIIKLKQNLYSIYYKSGSNLKQRAININNSIITFGNKLLINSNVSLFNKNNLAISNKKTLVTYVNLLNENEVALIDHSQLLLSISNSIVLEDTIFFDSSVLETFILSVTDTDNYLAIVYLKGTSYFQKVIKVDSNSLVLKYSVSTLKTLTTKLNIGRIGNNNFSVTYFTNSNSLEFDYVKFFNLNLKENLEYVSNSIKCNILNYNYDILETLEVYREDFSNDNFLNFSLAVIKLSLNSFGIVYHDNRNKIHLKKYKIENNSISTISKDIELKSGFTLFKNINLHAFNLTSLNQFLIIYDNPTNTFLNYDFIKKEIFNFSGGIESSENLDINIPNLDILSITWISGTTFELTLNSISDVEGLKEGMFFDITNDTDLISFNSINQQYSILSGTLNKLTKTFRFSHPSYNSSSFNKIDLGRLRLYSYDFKVNCSKKYETDYIGVYFTESTFSNHYINILNQNGIINHFGISFKLPGITNLNNISKANMDSSGITFLTYLNSSNQIEFRQFGADGNDINSIQIIGRNILSNFEIEKIAEVDNDIITLNYLNNNFGKNEMINLKYLEEYFISDITSFVSIEDTFNFRDRIQLYFIRNSNNFIEIRKKIDSIFSLTNDLNKIYLYISSDNKVFIRNNFNEDKTLKLIRKEQ